MLCVVRALWCPGCLGPLVLLVLVAGKRGWRGGAAGMWVCRDRLLQRSAQHPGWTGALAALPYADTACACCRCRKSYQCLCHC
jgi:hypothetical protein